MLGNRLRDHDDTPVDDKIVVLRGATWADYQRVLEMRGEVSSPRMAYLEGVLGAVVSSRHTPSKVRCTSKSPAARASRESTSPNYRAISTGRRPAKPFASIAPSSKR